MISKIHISKCSNVKLHGYVGSQLDIMGLVRHFEPVCQNFECLRVYINDIFGLINQFRTSKCDD